MKKVLQCDFCSHTVSEDQYSIMNQHETRCSFNPKNRECYSCAYRIDGAWPGDADRCNKEHGFCFMCDVDDGDIVCPDWAGE